MLNILGIGGHAKVIIQTVLLQFNYQIVIFDDIDAIVPPSS